MCQHVACYCPATAAQVPWAVAAGNRGLRDAGAAALAPAAVVLREMDLSGCGLGPEGAAALARCALPAAALVVGSLTLVRARARGRCGAGHVPVACGSIQQGP